MTLRELRDELGMSQRDFAKRLGVSQSTLCRWEARRRSPRVRDVKRLARELGRTAAALVELID